MVSWYMLFVMVGVVLFVLMLDGLVDLVGNVVGVEVVFYYDFCVLFMVMVCVGVVGVFVEGFVDIVFD